MHYIHIFFLIYMIFCYILLDKNSPIVKVLFDKKNINIICITIIMIETSLKNDTISHFS
jgi:hypothetical protein